MLNTYGVLPSVNVLPIFSYYIIYTSSYFRVAPCRTTSRHSHYTDKIASNWDATGATSRDMAICRIGHWLPRTLVAVFSVEGCFGARKQDMKIFLSFHHAKTGQLDKQ
jgi:hypothetical protein